jgi:tetratricopeptide (TPR) repeat protein
MTCPLSFFIFGFIDRGQIYRSFIKGYRRMKRPGFFLLVLLLILGVACGHICAKDGHIMKGPDFNLLLITIDTLRADHLGCYGYKEIETPTIDRLASEGVLFSKAFTPVPITLPSHVSIMTGVYPIQHGVRNNGNYILRQDALTLAEVMKANGYQTAACVGAFVLDSLFGLDQGFDFYDDSLPRKGRGATLLDNERKAEAVTKAGLDWLKKNRNAPFFLWLHYFDPHAIYLPPNPFDKEYKGRLYDGEIAYTDKCIGELIQGLKDMGLMERIVIILTSDHGEGLGEHGEPTHAIFIYDSTLHVPLIIRTPKNILPSRKVDAMISILDIFPTVLDLLSLPIKDRSVPHITGKSLVPLIRGKTDSLHREIQCESLYPELNFGWGRVEGIRTSDWKYIKASKPELYRLSKDPKEKRNLYPLESDKWQERLKKLKLTLGPEMETRVGLDDDVRDRLLSLGYVWSESSDMFEERHDPKDMIKILEKVDRGVSYIYLGLYKKARKEFQKILKVNPDNASVLFYLASVEERLGNFEDAERLFRAVLNLSAHYLDVHNHLGVIYHKQGNLDKSVEEFELALKQAEYPEVYYNLSVVLKQKGRHEEAVKAAKAALSLDPKYADVHNQLGQLAIDQGALDKAEVHLKEALKIEPDHLEAHNNLGIVQYRKGKDAEALRSFEKALSIDSNSPEALNNLGSVYLFQGKYDKAEEVFKKAVHINPSYFEGLLNLGSMHFHKKDCQSAKDLYLKAIEVNPESNEAWVRLGLLYLGQGEYEHAREVLEKALKTGPESADLYFYIGQVYLGLARPNDALGFWKKALAFDSYHSQTLLKMGQLFYDTGNWEEALNAWEKGYRSNPADPMPLMNMATVKFQKGEYDEAISLWERAREIAPDLDGPYLHIGTSYLRQKEIDKAINIWEKLLARKPEHPDALINLGTAFYQKGDIKGAIKFWQRAGELDSENPKVHYNLGLAFFSLKEYEGSVNELKEALRLDPSNQEVLMLLNQAKSLCPDQG